MKIYTKKGMLAVAAAIFAIAAAPVQADHMTEGAVLSADGTIISLECAKFGGLKETLTFVTFTNDDEDRPSLVGKLKKAHLKLHEDPPKICDAAQKLEDFSFKVTSLRDGRAGKGNKPKIFDNLPDGVGAVDCLIEGSAAIAAHLRKDLDCTIVEDPPRGKGPKNK